MPAYEPFHYRLVNLVLHQMPHRQPAGEMLGDLSVRLNAQERAATRVQIENKTLKNYAEMTGGHPAANK
jgi:hypothetical protein